MTIVHFITHYGIVYQLLFFLLLFFSSKEIIQDHMIEIVHNYLYK